MRPERTENRGTGLLNIQKFIFLLDDFHFAEFENHLVAINATLPRKLVFAIRKRLPQFHQPIELYKIVYGTSNVEVRAKFNQMASHTLRLSGYLALNFPGYLLHNQSRLEKLASAGLFDESVELAEMLYEIAERTENFDSLCHALVFLKNAAFIRDDMAEYKRYLTELEKSTEAKALYFRLYTTTERIYLELDKFVNTEQLNEHRQYFAAYHDHPNASIRMMSLYGYLIYVFYHNPNIFNDKADSEKAELLEKEMRNNPQVVLPYFQDLAGEVQFMKFSAGLNHLTGPEKLKGLEELTEHFKNIKFRNLDFKMGRQEILNMHATNMFHICMPLCYLPDYPFILPKPYPELLENLAQQCQDFIESDQERSAPDSSVRAATLLYAMFLTLAGKEKTKEGLVTFEGLLATYQQLNFKATTDTIFLFLTLGYFLLGNYEKVDYTVNRYTKNIKGKLNYSGNNMLIFMYYYLAKWLTTGSKQYPVKIQRLIDAEWHNRPIPARYTDMLTFFKVPFTAPFHPKAN